MLRPLSIALILLVLAPCGARAQPIDFGAVVSDLGHGVTVSVPVADAWSVRIHGSYGTWSRTALRSFGGLDLTTQERRTLGSVGVMAERKLGGTLGVSLGAWIVLANTRFESRASNVMLLGATLEPEEIGGLLAEASLPQRPSPYLGLHAVRPLTGRWLIRADLGALIAGEARQVETAEGRLSASSYWDRSPTRSRIVPAAQIGLVYRLHPPTPE